MKDNKQLLDSLLAEMERAIGQLRQDLKSDSSFTNLMDQFKLLLATGISSLEQEQELEQKRQVLNHIARFIKEKVAPNQDKFDIYLSAAYFLCREEDERLQIEETPSQKTQSVISAAEKCLIAVKVHYEKLNDEGLYSRKTEIFYIKANDDKPSVMRVEEEINWQSLTSDIRDFFIRKGENKISFQVYPSQE
ncbi:MAG: hypothetical protein AAF915_13875 [Cyanobacteria bacterium P01_D01_bin.50]